MPAMRKGEVWRVRLPTVSGHTQAGERPAVIVQNDPYLATLPTLLLVPFTSKLSASRFAGTLLVQPDGQNGLTMPSVALVFQLSAQDKRKLLNRLGTLDAPSLNLILAIILQLTR
jgi:mRNA interferase MazF